MKKITIDASSILPGRKMDGVGRTTLGLIEQFSSMDLPFELILFSQRLRGKRITDYKFKTCHLPLPRWSIFSKLTQALPIIESMCNSDLYHIPHNYAPFCQLDKVVVTLHDAMFLSYPEPHLGHEELAKVIPPFAKKCKAIITCSEHSKKDIAEYMDIDPKKIHVVYWGIDHELFKPTENKNELKDFLQIKFNLTSPYFFSNSCNIGRKNTPKLVESYLEFAKREPDNDLVLIWKNPPDDVMEFINKSPYRDRIKLLSNITDQELVKLYQGATATFIPSLYEGFGLPVLESMACGTPVVTTPFSSIPEVGGDAVMYIEPSIDNLISTMEKFENGSVEREKMIQDGLIQAKKFTWQQCANKTLEIYSKLLEE